MPFKPRKVGGKFGSRRADDATPRDRKPRRAFDSRTGGDDRPPRKTFDQDSRFGGDDRPPRKPFNRDGGAPSDRPARKNFDGDLRFGGEDLQWIDSISEGDFLCNHVWDPSFSPQSVSESE